ncbi:hypothetical protein GCM10009594_24120 [Kocuria palustris]|nr:MFS family permease [Kocuria palustris]
MNTASPSTGPRMTFQQVMDDRPMNSRRWLIVLLCFVVALLDGFDTQSIAFIGSSIAADFGMAATDMTWVITASTIGMALGAMTLGSAGDRFGRKRTIIVALTIFGVFSILGAFAQTTWQIIALRFLIGLGMGGATPALLALVAGVQPPETPRPVPEPRAARPPRRGTARRRGRSRVAADPGVARHVPAGRRPARDHDRGDVLLP